MVTRNQLRPWAVVHDGLALYEVVSESAQVIVLRNEKDGSTRELAPWMACNQLHLVIAAPSPVAPDVLPAAFEEAA